MKIAYFIMCHKHPGQVKRLLDAIYDEENLYVVHVDSKAEEDFQGIYDLAFLRNNVFMLDRQGVTWGCWSMVDVTLKALQFLLHSGKEWDFFINLSGQDFPLKSQRFIKDFLKANPIQNYIGVYPAPEVWRDVLKHTYLEMNGFITRIESERDPIEKYLGANVQLYRGSNWFILNRDFCEYLLSNPMLEQLIGYFRFTFTPDEMFFQTALMASPFRNNYVCDPKRIVPIPPGENSPIILRQVHFHELISSDAFFARKFDQSVDSDILDSLEKAIVQIK